MRGAFLDLFLPNCLLEEQIAAGFVFWVFVFFLINVGLCIFRTRLQIGPKISKACVLSAL